MRYLSSVTLLFFISFFFISENHAQYPEWNDANSLPQWMTPEEELRRHEIGKDFRTSAPPESPVRSIAEYERLKGALIRWPLGIPVELVAAMSQHAIVYTLAGSNNHINQATNAYSNAGANMENIEFILASTDSFWTRDYGPLFVATHDEVAIVDFPYNRPRPNDNNVPNAFSNYTGITRYGMDVVHTGGNYMSTGYGQAASTDLVYEENSNNQGFVLNQMYEYLGITDYHVTIDAQGEYIKHIDTWAKFLDVDKILIAEVPSNHNRYWAYEEVADYFAGQISSYGTPYEVVRVIAPNGEPYTNALILNEVVYVPLVGSSWDDDALATYQEAMPGYSIQGFYGDWFSTDALHCRVKDIADHEAIYVQHIPYHEAHNFREEFVIEAEIIAYSGAELYQDSLFVLYQVNQNIISKDDAAFDTIPLFHTDGHMFAGAIPVSEEDTLITYYIYAADASGRRETWPLIGAPGARSFVIDHSGELNVPLADANEFQMQAYPNPFNNRVSIEFEMKEPSGASLDVFDLHGRLVASLFDGHKDAGTHRVYWNGRATGGSGLPEGIYLARLIANGKAQSIRIMLSK